MEHQDALRRLTIDWTRAQTSVGRFIRSFVRDRGEAEDILQQVALVIVDRYETYDPDRPFLGWALGVARRVVWTHLREKYRDREVQITAAIEQVAEAFERLDPHAEPMKDALAGCVGKVRGHGRQALLLRYVEGLELKQIGERLGKSPSHVGVLLHRVRNALRERIQRRLAMEDP